jgi:plastocyanin
MHAAAIHLAPLFGAEKSKVPFYIAGGVLVGWALLVSALGLRRSDFPGNAAGQRAIIVITSLLVVGALSTAVITSGPAASGAAQTKATTGTPAAASTAASTPAASTSAPSAPASTPAPSAAAISLKLAADPAGGLSYDTKQLSAKAGTVTITMTNASPLEHNVVIALGSTVLGATPTFVGGTRTLTLKLKPGKYTFYCSVPGHRQAGMEGTLTVS